jgi:nitrate/nitrite-specific signal transduction histidine kinase
LAHKQDGLEAMKDRWDSIVQKVEIVTNSINKFQFSTLIRYFYISRFGYINEKKLYIRLIEKYSDYYKNNLNAFVEDFELVINLLITLAKKRTELSSEEIKSLPGKSSERGYLRTILCLKVFSVIQPYSLLLALFSKERNFDIRVWLNKIEVFHFVYSYICNGAAREFEKRYADTAKNVFQATSDIDVQASLNKLISEFSEILRETTNKEKFIQDISEKLAYGRDSDAIRFFYEYLEEDHFQRNLSGNTFINDSNISIDHIKPQSDGENHFIGNLVVLETDLNQQVKSDNYQIKKEKIMSNSGLSVTRYLFDKYDSWGPKEMNQWAEEAAALFWDSVVVKYFNLEKQSKKQY